MDIGNIESIHPVTPVQAALLERERENIKAVSLYGLRICALNKQIAPALFERAWQTILARHTILRASFAWKRIETVRQIVSKDLKLFAQYYDWRNLDSNQQEAHMKAHCAADADHGFDPSEAPLMRVTLARIADEQYRMAVSYHPLLLDDQSANALIEEFLALYDGSAEVAENRRKVPTFLKEYIGWVEQQDLASARAYWAETLKDFAPPASLRAQPSIDSARQSRLATHRRPLPSELAASLITIAESNGFDLDSVLMCAWAVLRSRYTGEETISIGIRLSARPQVFDEADNMIGPLTNCLPLLVRLPAAKTALHLLEEIDSSLKKIREFSFCSDLQLREWAGLDRETELYESAFRLDGKSKDSTRNLNSKNCDNTGADIFIGGPLATLKGSLGAGSFLRLSVDESCIDNDAASRMLGHLETILASLAHDTEQRTSAIPILTRAETEQILVEFSGDTEAYPGHFFHQLFEAQATRRPDAIALTYEQSSLGYAELNRRANQLAHKLKALGVAPETKVGIYLSRSPELIVSLLAVLKTGGAYVPLDPTYPFERLLMIFEDAQPTVLLTEEGLSDHLPVMWAQVVCLDSDWQEIALERDDNPDYAIDADSLAYVIYTSGSSGTPKGVMVAHRGLMNLAQAQITAFAITEASHVLQFASLNFDASIWEIMMALSVGATLHLGSRDTLMPGPGLVDALQTRAITTVTLPPSFLTVLPEEELHALSTVISAGEACSQEIATRWSSGRRFVNAYGPTEVTVCATVTDRLGPGEKPGIGRPMKNVKVYLLDRRFRLVPVGVLGELCVGGAGLARGYLNRPDLTADRFMPDEFACSPGERLYRTGDLAAHRANGDIDYCGRMDDQIKVRGVRIEAGEIEAVLRRHPAVKQAVAAARQGPAGASQLVAYIIPDQEFLSASDDTAHDPGLDAVNRIELWPSVSEYAIYDELIYYAMTNDERRNKAYKAALEAIVAGKVAVDISAGPDVALARLCVEAGARKVYAVELLDETCKRAQSSIERLGLTDKITLIQGDSTQVRLPEPVDVCVSTLFGPIAGSAGAALILNDARRFLKDGGAMVPELCMTKIAAVSVPDDLLDAPAFAEISAYYARKIFEAVGYQFDFRLCLKYFPQSGLISNSEIFELLDFRGPVDLEYDRKIELSINKNSRLDGFLLWLSLRAKEGEVIDILEQEHYWLPVYFPVFNPGLDVEKGDRIEATCSSRLSDDRLNPDYFITGRVLRDGKEICGFDYNSFHHRESFKADPFYEKLFSVESAKARPGPERGGLPIKSLRSHLGRFFPDYMIPTEFVLMRELPLSPNGKIDRAALPSPEQARPELEEAYAAPRTPLEETLARIWSKVLGVGQVGIHDNFFELRGHSLLATQVLSQVRESFQIELPLRNLFESPTVAGLAQAIELARWADTEPELAQASAELELGEL